MPEEVALDSSQYDYDEDWEEYDDYEDVDSLDYVLRGRSLSSRLSSGVMSAPWWIVSVALHFVAAMFLGKVLMMSPASNRVEDVIIETTFQRDPPTQLDLQKIEQIFKALNTAAPEAKMVAPVLVTENLTKAPEMDLSQIDVEPMGEVDTSEMIEEDFIGPGEDTFGEEGHGLGAFQEEGILGHGEWNTTVRGLGGYGKVMDNMSVRLSQQARKFGGNVLLVWLIDASVSMTDDQQAIKEHISKMDRKFREQEGAGNLKQAIIQFGSEPKKWLEPTEDLDLVMEAFDHIEANEPGTAENVMTALIYCAQEFRNIRRGKKVVILVDDDSGDDGHLTEKAFQELRRSKMTTYIINRMCPFQSSEVSEPFKYTDENGDIWEGTGTVRRGPETARPEIYELGYGGISSWRKGSIPSGFGIYDQSRVAYRTSGAYYILDSDPEQEKAMRELYDWELMERYSPELCSRNEYDARTARNVFKRSLELITNQWDSVRAPGGGMPPDAITQNLKACKDKLEQVDEILDYMEKRVIVPDSRLSSITRNRRWVANADLMYAFLQLAKYRLRQYYLGFRLFLKENEGKIPKDHVISARPRQKPIESKYEAQDRADAIASIRSLANRHPRTPWGHIASLFDPDSTDDLYGWRFSHSKPPFRGYWAKVVFRDNSEMELYVMMEDERRVKLRNRKGLERTVSKKLIKSITRIQTARTGGGGGRMGGRPANPRI
ncbi:MAG: VWA domain-containing protein [Planctomycetota bacterium]|jgi:hypothetical protein|nr:VWA domain-containing protein [Planctomycetota bacterium]